MTDNPPPSRPGERDLETEWNAIIKQLEDFGINIAQWLTGLGIGEDADLRTITLAEPISRARRPAVRLEMTIGRASIRALPTGSKSLIEANVTSIGPVEMSATTSGEEKAVRLRQKRFTAPTAANDLFKPVKDAVDTVARIDELNWDIKLSPDVPLNLTVSAGLTIDNFDFTGLNLAKLSMDGGTGHCVVKMPAGVANAAIEGSVGVFDMMIPDGAKLTLAMDNGAGSTNIFIGHATVKAEIEGGVGACKIYVPHDAAVRLRADSGLGNIVVPERLKEVEFESEFISESGRWETPGFEFAPNKIDIR
ncbi:MAG: hypothetical protein AAF653_07395 [Chloroflexota bacterium]